MLQGFLTLINPGSISLICEQFDLTIKVPNFDFHDNFAFDFFTFNLLKKIKIQHFGLSPYCMVLFEKSPSLYLG